MLTKCLRQEVNAVDGPADGCSVATLKLDCKTVVFPSTPGWMRLDAVF